MLGNDQIKKFMNTPMSRQQFLRYIGLMLLSLVGIGNVITSLMQSHEKALPSADPIKARQGFGGGKYGS